jgi:hypothetical protein
MERELTWATTSVVPARVGAVWSRVTTAEGIDDELRPWLSMRMPRRWRGSSLGEVPVGEPLGRAWLRLGGVVPVDYDDLHLVAVNAPTSFHERSTMATARVWEHRRTLEATPDGGTRVTDQLRLVPRLPLPGPVARLVRGAGRALFAHRHRRLAAWVRASGPERRDT